MDITSLIGPGLIAASIVFLVTPYVVRAAHHYRLLDAPHLRRHPAQTHRGIVPRAGGLAIFVGFFVAAMIFIPFSKTTLGIMAAALLTVTIGLLDDRFDLSPYVRFIANILTALLVVGVGIGIPYVTNPLGPGVIRLDQWIITGSLLGSHTILVWADFFAVIWIVWTMNIVGWSSGVDGQMPGFVAITAVVLGLMSLRFSAHDVSQTIVATLAFITAGAFIGFLPWNFYPQKIMPGYSGKTLAGLLIAVLAILSGNKVGSALLVLSVPMIDAGFTFIRRMLKRKSPFRADRSHLHHYLLDAGWGRRRIALFYWTISFILGLFTLQLNSQQKVFTFLMVAMTICGVLVWFSLSFIQQKKQQ